MRSPLARRRELRRHSTDAESTLGFHLRDRRLAGFKFRRQYPCGPFILDFFCAEARLAIELDGGQHYENAGLAYDARRSRFLADRGVTVIRFANDLMFREREGVLAAIARALGVPSP